MSTCVAFLSRAMVPYSPDSNRSKRPTSSSRALLRKAVERTPHPLWDKIGAQHEFLNHKVEREGRKRGA